jgi:glutathione S-transferase
MWLTNTLQATLIIYFYPHRWVDDDAAAGQVKRHAEAKIDGLIDQLEAELVRHGGPFLLGDQFTLLDPYALMLCRWTRGFNRPARDLPALGAYLRRLLERPAIRRVFEREGLAAPGI